MAKSAKQKSRKKIHYAVGALLLVTLFVLATYESYSSLYDAEYVGSRKCGECHTEIYAEWKNSPHALMTRKPDETSVVGDFDRHRWFLPETYRKSDLDTMAAAIMYKRNNQYYMALRRPGGTRFEPFPIDYVIGYQYRQVYLTREAGGVLRRLPLQWSQSMKTFFPYWNTQEGSDISSEDLWAQMRSQNSAWNLFCARCHTTNLEIEFKNSSHTAARVKWTDDGIGCESCHGPGSYHETYFDANYVNRIAAFLNSKVRGEPVAYIALAPKLTKGQDLSTCARCHGPDIMMSSTDLYRQYEPGYSRLGRTNDLSAHFKEFPLQPGRTDPTVECWADSRPKGIGMLFRSFIESRCYEAAEVRCYNCHNPHDNKQPTANGILEASATSNSYCLTCHSQLEKNLELHTHHPINSEGSFCYDCHMPREIANLVSGQLKMSRTHTMSSIPDPRRSIEFGLEGSPNACNDCHSDKPVEWAAEWAGKWWPGE